MSKKILQRIRRKTFSNRFSTTNDEEEYYQKVNSMDHPFQFSQENIDKLNKINPLNQPLEYRPGQQIFYNKYTKNKSLITEDPHQSNITQYSIRNQNTSTISTIYKKNISTSPRIHQINYPVYRKRIGPNLHKKKLPIKKERCFSSNFNNNITNNNNFNTSQDSKANIHEIIIDMPQFNTNNVNNNTLIYNSKLKTMKTNSSSYSVCFYPKKINKNSNYTMRDSSDNLQEIYNEISNSNNNDYSNEINGYGVRKKKYIKQNNNNSVNSIFYSQRNNNFDIEDHYNDNIHKKNNKSENFMVHNNNIRNNCSNFLVLNENEFFDQAAIMIQSTFRGYNFRYKLCNILTRFDKIRNIYDILKNAFNELGKEVWKTFILILKKQTKLLAEKKFYNDYVINNENSLISETCKIKNMTESSKNYYRDNSITFSFFHKAKNSCFYLAEQLIQERDELKKELSEVISKKKELEEKLRNYEKNENIRLERKNKLKNLIIKKILYQNKVSYLYFYKYYFKVIENKRLKEIEINKNQILRKIIKQGNKQNLYKYFFRFLYKGIIYHKNLIRVNKKQEKVQYNNEMNMSVEISRNEKEGIINAVNAYKRNHVKKNRRENNQRMREEKKMINNILENY